MTVVPVVRHTVEVEDLAVHVVQDRVLRMVVPGHALVTFLQGFLRVRLIVLLDGALPSARKRPITVVSAPRSGQSENVVKKRMQATSGTWGGVGLRAGGAGGLGEA